MMADNRMRLSFFFYPEGLFLASSHQLPRRGCISSVMGHKDFRVPNSHIRKQTNTNQAVLRNSNHPAEKANPGLSSNEGQ